MGKSDDGEWEILAKSIPEPADYYHGVCPKSLETPRNVLLFARTTSSFLLQREHFAFQHSRFVLIACIASAGSVAIDGHWHRLHPGQALLVFPYQVHAFAEIEGPAMCWIFLTFELTEAAPLQRLRQHVADLSLDGEGWLRQVLESWRTKETGPRTLALLTALILEDLQAHLPRRRRAPARRQEPAPQLLTRIHAIAEQDDPACRIKDLARRLGISEPHLRAQFRDLTGQSLGAYLRKLRMTRAAALLSSSAHSVGEIAARCGFDTLYSFSRSFRQAMGFSPSAYRRRQQRR